MSTTRVRNFRAEDELYEAATAKAAKLGMSISTALRLLLQNFIHTEKITIGKVQKINNLDKNRGIQKISEDYIEATTKLLANRDALTHPKKPLARNARRKK